MRFLVDQCVGSRLADWLRERGHDVVEARELGADPGDRALLARAVDENRILVTIDTDFGELVCLGNLSHAGLIRLPDVPVERRIALMTAALERRRKELEAQAVITISSDRIRISHRRQH